MPASSTGACCPEPDSSASATTTWRIWSSGWPRAGSIQHGPGSGTPLSASPGTTPTPRARGPALFKYLRHHSRPYIVSAAPPPARAAAALEGFRVIEDEPWRVQAVQRNAKHFIESVRGRGLHTLQTRTAIVPVLCGTDERAFQMTAEAHRPDLFVLPVASAAA